MGCATNRRVELAGYLPGMREEQRLLHMLEAGELHRFADWPNAEVPKVAAGTYTVWDGGTLIYAGMAGRSLTPDSILSHRDDPTRVTGLHSRLGSHASGRRSGDQFCVYVAEYLVLPQLDRSQREAIANRETGFDLLVRQYIADHLSYRYVETPDGSTARDLEHMVRRGDLAAGKPFLNPS